MTNCNSFNGYDKHCPECDCTIGEIACKICGEIMKNTQHPRWRNSGEFVYECDSCGHRFSFDTSG